jgi:3-methyladenine DNA glycosylase AlkD
MTAGEVKVALDKHADAKAAEFAQRFFKTGEWQYGAGDKFIGLRVPTIRTVCKKYKGLALAETGKLLASPIHEHRLAALIIMTEQAKKATPEYKKQLYNFYLKNIKQVNNWDLVDTSCPMIVGGYLLDKSHTPLYKLARSKNLWEKRIAMISTLQFIRAGQLNDTFAIAKILINDNHDLIHKAVGWMLRCAGDVDRAALLEFLDTHAHQLRRTALRYSLEHLTPDQKTTYMQATESKYAGTASS